MNMFSRFLLNREKHPLSYRLLFYVVICSSLFALLATITQLYFEYRRDISHINNNFRLIEESYLQPISTAVYKINEEQLKFLLEGMLELQHIECLEINEKRGLKEVTFSTGNPDVEKDIIRNFPLEYVKPTGQIVSIGTLTATASLKGVYRRLWSSAIIVLSTNVVKTFLASFFILLIIQLIITRHLNTIANYARLLDLNQLEKQLVLSEKTLKPSNPDEIDQIVLAINTLQNRIKTSFAKRKQAEDDLQIAHDTLETKVEERTKMLKETNEKLVIEASERQKAEESLKRFRLVMDHSGEAIFITSLDTGQFIDVNATACRLLGYERSELISMSIGDVEQKYPSITELLVHLDEVKEKGETGFFDNGIHVRKDGSTFPVEVYISSKTVNNQSFLLAAARDITERKQAECQIKASLKEKETLLKEIHHRVKNNMQVISSLLKLQMRSTDDKKIKTALEDSQLRIQAMSFIHETLYGSEDLSSIDMKSYLLRLIGSIEQSYQKNIGKVKTIIDASNIILGVKQVTPLGLIVNELLSNSFKYAFPYVGEGEIKIVLRKKEDGQIKLTYSDNGIGLPANFDWYNTKSLGLNLVKLLSENQLDGSIELIKGEGTCFVINFKQEDTPVGLSS